MKTANDNGSLRYVMAVAGWVAVIAIVMGVAKNMLVEEQKTEQIRMILEIERLRKEGGGDLKKGGGTHLEEGTRKKTGVEF